MARPDDDPGGRSLRFAIQDCFAITGRGVIVTRHVEIGAIHVGDIVELVHAGSVIRTRCAGVEMGHGRGPDGTSVGFVGVLLPGIRTFDVAPGDHVRGLDADRARRGSV